MGCGKIAKKHINALEQIKGARLAAVCDINPQNLLTFAKENGISSYTDYTSFLKNADIDAVIICTPSGLHTSMGQKAAEAGKHILVEKPFTLDIDQGKKLIELCKLKGVKLGVVHPNRAKKIVKALKKAVDNGWFGKITHASAVLRWNRSEEYYNAAAWRGTIKLDGGILFNQAIHNIDLLNWLIGPVDEVFAYSEKMLRKIEYEDVCVCTLKFKNGALGIIEAAVTLYPENLEESLSVFGSHGTAVLTGKTLSKIEKWKFSCITDDEAESNIEQLNNKINLAGHKLVIEDFIQAINQNREPLVSGNRAIEVLQLINAIYQSANLKLPVKLQE